MGKQSSYGNQTPTGSDYVTGVKGTSTASFLFSDILTYIAGAIMALISNPYKFSAYRNSAFSAAPAYPVVPFDVEEYDTNNNLSAGVYTAPIAGYYFFSAALNIAAAGDDSTIALFKNASEFKRGGQVQGPTNAGLTVSHLIPLAAGDTVDVRAYSANSHALNIAGPYQNYFSGFLVSKT